MANDPLIFSNCGQEGREGPSQAQADAAYALTELAGKVAVSAGIQQWIVPSDGAYEIEAAGAQGGGTAGGLGARIKGAFELTEGQVLYIGVGQAGTPMGIGNGSGNNNSSGGGGSFVRLADGTPLIVAGGGAGGMNAAHEPRHGQATEQAGSASAGTGTGATSGAGWTVGGSGNAGSLSTTALGCLTNSFNEGGFGGGGSTSSQGSFGRCGGGGGYNGGAQVTARGNQSGGGGGSFNAGAEPEAEAGVNEGHGYLKITSLMPDIGDSIWAEITTDDSETNATFKTGLMFNHTSGYTAPHYTLVVFGQTAPAFFSVDQTTDAVEGSGVFERWPLRISETQEVTTATGTAYIEHIEPRVSITQESTEATGTAYIEHIEPVEFYAQVTTEATASGTFIMEVYCLSGAVRNQTGDPMERTVRAHRLNDGTLVAETVSNSAGIFDINVGFESAEFYVIALDTGPEGTDYLPPIANRVTSVLRYD